jgi:hypothetical protein
LESKHGLNLWEAGWWAYEWKRDEWERNWEGRGV